MPLPWPAPPNGLVHSNTYASPVREMLLIFAGGGIGAVARFLAAEWSVRRFGVHFPIGTLAVNVSGCFLIGLLSAGLLAGGPGGAHAGLRHFLLTGVLGGYTTFSTFSLQT